MPEQQGAVESGQLHVRAGRDGVMVLAARMGAEAVGVRQPLVVVFEVRRQRVHELKPDAELCADVCVAGGDEGLLDGCDVESFRGWPFAMAPGGPREHDGAAFFNDAGGKVARRITAVAFAAALAAAFAAAFAAAVTA